MSEISGKLLGLLATLALFVAAIMVAVYPDMQDQGDVVGDQISETTSSMPKANEITW